MKALAVYCGSATPADPRYIELAREVGDTLARRGIGVAIEKGFQGGGKKLRDSGVNLHSLAVIERADENGIVFRADE